MVHERWIDKVLANDLQTIIKLKCLIDVETSIVSEPPNCNC